jgi:hypothetical protein
MKDADTAMTIADLATVDVKGLHIRCRTPGCWHGSELPLSGLSVPDSTRVSDLTKLDVIFCTACGGSDLYIYPDWGTDESL